jgi:hypothetical protein
MTQQAEKSVEQLLDEGDNIGALMQLLEECGAKVTLYGEPVSGNELRAFAASRMTERMTAAATPKERPTCTNLMPRGAGSGHWRDWHRGHGCNLDPTP